MIWNQGGKVVVLFGRLCDLVRKGSTRLTVDDDLHTMAKVLRTTINGQGQGRIIEASKIKDLIEKWQRENAMETYTPGQRRNYRRKKRKMMEKVGRDEGNKC